MEIVYTTEEPPQTYSRSIFLAGPSPRQEGQPNWRPEAIRLLEEMGYDGVVYVPLPRNGEWPKSYDSVASWERKNLDRADCILFWVPRDMGSMIGLTTNIEFGTWYDSGRAVVGYPLDAPHTRYLGLCAKEEAVPLSHTLQETCAAAVKMVQGVFGLGSERTGGERDIPLVIWEKQDFLNWYVAQKRAGNRLDSAKIVWNYRVGPLKSRIFLYALHVHVWIGSEGRSKTNEVVIFRPDISTIVAYRHAPVTPKSILNTEIVLIREFRSPASNEDAMVHELPGGSSWKPDEDPTEIAAHEFAEETGFKMDPSRFRYVNRRQIASTLSAHKAHVFAIELSDSEMDTIETEAKSGEAHGVIEDTERTYVEIRKFGDIIEQRLLDWSMIGMISEVLLQEPGFGVRRDEFGVQDN